MNFERCQQKDLMELLELYNSAIQFQKKTSNYAWLDFRHDRVLEEIESGLIWKILEEDLILGTFVLLFEDPHIWDDLECGNAVYLHRIISARKGTGMLMPALLNWAKNYAKQYGRQYVRMDTWSEHKKLSDYYLQLGFTSLGNSKIKNPHLLPSTYSSSSLILLQIESE